ncbi:hypothetical protein F2Q68_00011881 [Brassica cretica]|uniref:Uncharacterized protein n=1 Tax=Brassica cretica TaxID=69181 RepID=A0A8S9KWX2_BRACR|nr:hypothetical protein F2Q68_00011881 [Brassica cretica]
MDFNPFTSSSNFVDLLSSQQQNVVFGSVSDSVSLSSSQPLFFGVQGTDDSNFEEDTQARWKERRTWSRIDDVVLISSWLNTSKDEMEGSTDMKLHGSRQMTKQRSAYSWIKANEEGLELMLCSGG